MVLFACCSPARAPAAGQERTKTAIRSTISADPSCATGRARTPSLPAPCSVLTLDTLDAAEELAQRLLERLLADARRAVALVARCRAERRF
ncbi:MAG: hypothetical protein ACLU38_14525 [Dysosmobacter sp.]